MIKADFLFKNINQKQIIAKNFFWLSFSQISGRVLKAILIILAARILGASEYGRFSLSLSILSLFFVFADSGISSLVTRELSKKIKESKEYLSTSFYLKSLLLIFSIILVILAQFFIPSNKLKEIVLILLIMTALENIISFFYGIIRSTERMEKEALIYLSEIIVSVGLGFFVLFNFPSAKNLAWAYSLGAIVAFLVALIVLRKYLKIFFFYFQKKLVKKIALDAWPFAFLALVGRILTYTDVVMIGFLLRKSYLVGLYSAPLRVITFFQLPAILLAASILPSLSRKIIDKSEIVLIKKSLVFLSAIALPLIAGGLILSREIILFLFGQEYLASAKIFSLLILVIFFLYFIIIFSHLLFAYNFQKKNALFLSLSALVNVFLNFILISKFSIVGAALATLFSQIFCFFLFLFEVKKIEKTWPITFFDLRKIFFASLLMAVFLYLLKFFSFPLPILIFLGALIYLFFLFLFREPSLKEIREIFSQ